MNVGLASTTERMSMVALSSPPSVLYKATNCLLPVETQENVVRIGSLQRRL